MEGVVVFDIVMSSSVGDELKATKANGFTEGATTAHQVLTVSGDGER
jgi:hypothetical protein